MNMYSFFFKTIDRFYSGSGSIDCHLADIINHDSLATFCK